MRSSASGGQGDAQIDGGASAGGRHVRGGRVRGRGRCAGWRGARRDDRRGVRQRDARRPVGVLRVLPGRVTAVTR
ncbi:MAG: hypothetical protein FJ207_05855 [Gemmatimonadetes bacterium]|nr:hypothetical protein [Gemmatimonadota bacterium]